MEILFYFLFFQYYGPIFSLKSNFSGKSLSYHVKLFLVLLLVYFRKFGGAVSSQIPKNCDFGPKWPFFGTFGQNGHFLAHLAKIGQNENFIKNRAVLFFTLIVPQLHAEFQKNRWSGFRDQFATSEHPNIRKSEQR